MGSSVFGLLVLTSLVKVNLAQVAIHLERLLCPLGSSAANANNDADNPGFHLAKLALSLDTPSTWFAVAEAEFYEGKESTPQKNAKDGSLAHTISVGKTDKTKLTKHSPNGDTATVAQ